MHENGTNTLQQLACEEQSRMADIDADIAAHEAQIAELRSVRSVIEARARARWTTNHG